MFIQGNARNLQPYQYSYFSILYAGLCCWHYVGFWPCRRWGDVFFGGGCVVLYENSCTFVLLSKPNQEKNISPFVATGPNKKENMSLFIATKPNKKENMSPFVATESN